MRFSEKKEKGNNGVVSSTSTINLIGERTKIKGDLNSAGDLRVDGVVKGSIKSNTKVVIGPKGLVDGDIQCKNADISGAITGNLMVKELLSLKATSNIEGNVIATKFVIESGARFNGSCSMGVTKEMAHEVEVPAKLEETIV